MLFITRRLFEIAAGSSVHRQHLVEPFAREQIIVSLLVRLEYLIGRMARIRAIFLRNAREVSVPGSVELGIGINGGLCLDRPRAVWNRGKNRRVRAGWLTSSIVGVKRHGVVKIHRKRDIATTDDAIMWTFM